MNIRRGAMILAVLAACSLAHARHNGDYLRQVTTRLQTPHVDIVPRYAPGQPHVLFITPRTFAPREIVELWQRFDLDFDAFTTAHSGLMSFESDAGAAPYDLAVEGTSIEEKTAELLGLLAKPHEAFVMANASLDMLPKEAQYRLLKQVNDGAGLLFTYGRMTRLPIFKQPLADGRDQITQGVPLAATDFFAREDIRKALRVQADSDIPGKVVETYRFGQGRIAVLTWGSGSGTYYGGHGLTPPEAYSLHWAADYDTFLSLVYRALLWTVGSRQQAVQFTGLPAGGTVYPRDSLPQQIPITLKAAKPLAGKLTVTVRDHTSAVEARQELPLKLTAGDNSVGVSLPRVKAGRHFLDLAVVSPQGVEQWGTVWCEVTAPVTLAQFGAASEFCEQGQAPALAATLSAPAPPQATIRLSLTDTNDRLYLQRAVPVPAGQTTVSLGQADLSGATTIASRLHGELLVAGQPVDARDQFLFVPRRQSDEFRSVIWGVGGDSGLTWLAMRQLRAAGFTYHLSHPSASGSVERLMALCDLPLVCYAYRVMGGADDRGWRKDHWVKDVADGCVYNPELQQKASASVLGRIKNVIPYGVSLYSLGDENYFDYESGSSPVGLQSFRAMLQRKYASLQQLNATWGTQFANWEEVKPLPTADAIKQGQWPAVHDHMSFNEQEYAFYHHFLREEIRKADPGAWVGAEGSVPGDLEETVAGLEIWGPYSDKRGNELLRSLVSPQVVRGNWWGGYVGSHGGRAGADILWRQLISGAVNTSLYFAAVGSEGLFATELSYADYFDKMLPDLGEIYGGIGQLFAAGRVPDDGIAIHWSQASEHAAKMFTGVGTPAASQGNLLALLDRCGFGYRFVTTKMIGQGALDRGVRVLFLPCSQALSDEEVKRISAFVDAGGLLIADVGAGLMDGNCKPKWKVGGAWEGQLDALLGVTRKGDPQSQQTPASQTLDLGGAKLPLRDFPFRPDSSVVAQSTAQIGDAPIFLLRSHGQGRVVFLNFTFPNAEHPDAVPFCRDLLATLQVAPRCHLTESKGYLARRFAQGGLELIGVAREGKNAPDTTLQLAQPAYVYDVRAGKALGKLTSVALSAGGPPVRVFALLPTPAKAPTVASPAAAARGRATNLALTLPGAAAGRLLRLQALRPDGAEAMPYRAYVTMPGTQTTARLPWAYSDPPGAWTVRVTDVATGQSGSCKISLR